MEKFRARVEISFSTKVVLPVIGAMVLVIAITVWLVNHRITQQFQDDAVRSLAHADAVLRYSHQKHAENLLLPFRHLPKEPRYKAAAQAAEQNELGTLKQLFEELLTERNADVILFTSDRLEACGASREGLFSLTEFQSSCASVAAKALHGEIKSDTIRAGEKLFEVVSIPLTGVGESIVGALTFGQEIGNTTAHEFGLFTRNQIVLLANGHVIASTIPGPELNEQFVRLFADSTAIRTRSQRDKGVKEVLVGEHHYYYAAGQFESLSGDGELGYILLSSYEEPLRALRTTQQLLLICNGLAILAGAAIVWWLVHKVTEPLRALRDSAEAVGRGDFSQRVKVVSRDECGELAKVFNQTTEKLKRLREELEATVEALKTTQTQLVQSEKLSGIGEFVAGVAHELNNPLTTVMGFSELLEQVDQDPHHKRYLEMIRKSAQRCHKIVQSLLSFARRRPAERKMSNVNELIEGAIDFLAYQLRTSNVEVTCRLDPNLPKTLVDPHQVQQVFLNLLNNARQAIEAHQPSGCIWIITESLGERVRVVIQDNGPGIPDANLAKVFDPFFTTKEVGKGTGLGLSLCYGIVKEHGGTMNVQSKAGEGATFVLELPITTQSEEPPGQPRGSTINGTREREGLGKKVLVIDDEESILQMVRDTLAEQGYEVDTASDGEAALNRLKQIPYDLALCDWKMPGLNGQQIFERVRTSDPDMSNRMIFFTGDVINDKAQKFLKEAHKVCLAKPFSLAEFRSAIGQAVMAVT